jgi:hypothetical protein
MKHLLIVLVLHITTMAQSDSDDPWQVLVTAEPQDDTLDTDPPTPPAKKKRGRPPKTRCTASTLSRLDLGPPSSSSTSNLTTPALSLLRPTGGAIGISLCTLVQSPKPAIPEVQKVLVEFLGPLPRGSLPMQAESRILGMSRYKVNTYTNDLAALVFYFTRHFVTSIISSLLFKVETGCIELIASFRFYMHDETTFVTRVLRFCKEKPTATPEDIAAELLKPSPSTADTKSKATSTSKVNQFELTVGILYKLIATNTFVFICIPLVAPLLTADRNKSEPIGEMLRRLWDIPLLETLLKKCKHNFDACNMDGASCNLKYEDYADLVLFLTSIRIHITCMLHHLHGVQGRVYMPIGNFISGTLALALSMKIGGAPERFRKALADYFSQKVVIVNSAPPGVEDPRFQYRKAFFDLCLPKTL